VEPQRFAHRAWFAIPQRGRRLDVREQERERARGLPHAGQCRAARGARLPPVRSAPYQRVHRIVGGRRRVTVLSSDGQEKAPDSAFGCHYASCTRAVEDTGVGASRPLVATRRLAFAGELVDARAGSSTARRRGPVCPGAELLGACLRWGRLRGSSAALGPLGCRWRPERWRRSGRLCRLCLRLEGWPVDRTRVTR